MDIRKMLNSKRMRIAKYIVVTLLFIIWVVFLDVHNFKNQVNYRVKINELEEEKAYYLSKIKEDSLRLEELNTDDENLEKYAREKYYMKKENEEIFLVRKKNEE